jgi:small neutral amino acid transporter SnatA (MarC family)
LIAGPSALATVVLLAARQPEQASAWGAAIVLAMGVGWAVLAMAEHLSHRLNPVALRAMERFMGLLLSAMAVEMLTSGLRRAFGP